MYTGAAHRHTKGVPGAQEAHAEGHGVSDREGFPETCVVITWGLPGIGSS